jgi:predicted lipoprotein with Yx(FWY)xxD motif
VEYNMAMRLLRILVPFVAAVVVLAACGSGGSKKSSSATTTAPAVTTTAPSPTTAQPNAAAIVKTAATSLGTILVSGEGRTLYHRTDESATHIVCTGACATTWPPFLGEGTTGVGSGIPPLTTVKRPDGTSQVVAGGQPLYTYAGDSKAGDTNGQGVGGIWFVIKAGS